MHVPLLSTVIRLKPTYLLTLSVAAISVVDLLLAGLYIAQYCATEFTTPRVVLPFHIAAVTQALLVCGEFWFFAIPIDMVQSITNPFTSYVHNFRVYWFYSVLSGVLCGLVLWYHPVGIEDCGAEPCAPEADERFFWFHHNTDTPGFFWHRWILYHVWVLVYLIFGGICIIYVTRRLRRGLEETFDVRRRVLSNGLLTCAIYISWSTAIVCLFGMTNSQTVKEYLGPTVFQQLIYVCAFLHAARGCLNMIVWLVVNGPNLRLLMFGPALSRSSSIASSSVSTVSTDWDDEENLWKPELNTALRSQMIQMATTGIVESVEHFHRLRQRIQSNQTFHLDWERSMSREVRTLSTSMSLSEVVATRNPTVRVVEALDKAATPRFSFMPMVMKEMQFYDFQPRMFASIRQLYGIDDTQYVYAFRDTINERISEGRSGAFVFNTLDRKYLVKSMTSAEKNVLLALLPSYLRYLKWNPHTLLPRFFGVHAMKMYGQIFYFVVMGNIMNTKETIHRRYDIKGSWVDRNAPACVLGEKYRCSKCNRFFVFGSSDTIACESTGADHYPDITLRDNDLKKRLKLDPHTAARLLKQLTRDTNFLASMGIMDYSLLIGTHYSHFTISTKSATKDHIECIDPTVPGEETPTELLQITCDDHEELESSRSNIGQHKGTHADNHRYRAHQVSGPSSYHLGLVDILQQWTFSKQAERVYKVHVLRKSARGVSAIAPEHYATRFQRKMKQLLITTPLGSFDALDDAADDIEDCRV